MSKAVQYFFTASPDEHYCLSNSSHVSTAIIQSDRAAWQTWLQQRLGFVFSGQIHDWSLLLRDMGEAPTLPLTCADTFDRVSQLLASRRLNVHRLPVESNPSHTPAGVTTAAATRTSTLTPTAAATTASATTPGGAAGAVAATSIADQQCQGDPVSPTTGEEILRLEDFSAGGMPPLTWSRLYRSSRCQQDGGLGHGWFVIWLRGLYEMTDQIWIEDDEGRRISYPRPAVGEYVWQTTTGQRLSHPHPDEWHLTDRDGTLWTFQRTATTTRTGAQAQLIHQRQPHGQHWRCHWNTHQQLYQMDRNGIPTLALQWSRTHLQHIYLCADTAPELLVSYTIDDHGDLISAGAAPRREEHYEYSQHLLSQRQRSSGYRLHFKWDGTGPGARCIRNWGEDGRHDLRFDYRPHRITAVTDSRGNLRLFEYDELGRVTRRTEADGAVFTWTFNTTGRLCERGLPDGSTHQLHYDTRGRLMAETLPDGRRHERRFNALGYCIAETLPDGRSITRQIDSLGRLLAEQRADGSQWSYQYNGHGVRQQQHNPSGEQATLGHNAQGQVVAACLQGNLVRYSYNARGQRQGLLVNGRVTEQEYQHGLLIAEHRYPQAAPHSRHSRHFGYDQAGRLTTYTDSLGQVHQFHYHYRHKPDNYTAPDHSVVSYQYDHYDRLTRVIRPDQQAWTLAYNESSRVNQCQTPDGRQLQFDYDLRGQIMGRTIGQQWQQHLTRDRGGRVLTQHTAAAGRATVSKQFQYDEYGRRKMAITTRQTSASPAPAPHRSSAHQLHWHYDALGNLSREQQGPHCIGYEYRAGGLLSRMTLPPQTAGTHHTDIEYRYDPYGHWQHLCINGDIVITRVLNTQGQEIERYAPGNQRRQQYDREGLLLSQHWQGLTTTLTRRHTWDSEHRLESVKDTHLGEQHFSRDLLGQLLSDGSQQYLYDTAGNRLSLDDHGQPYSLEQDQRSFDSTYDPLGAEITRQLQQRQFDAEGNLLRVQHHGETVHYQYDALGRRTGRQHGEEATTYLWQGDNLLGQRTEISGKTSPWQWFIRDPHTREPLATIINGSPCFYENDWRQLPVRLWDQQGHIVWQARSDGWGNLTQQDEANQNHTDTGNSLNSAAISQPLRLPGQFADPLTGLYYNRFRDYDPQTGRYLTPDPIGLNGGLNSYRYTKNPVDFVDPLGLCDETPILDTITGLGISIAAGTLEALAWLNEQTEIPTLSELQTDVQADLDKLGATALNTGNDWAVPLLGITYAASEALLPTSTLDILPVGKAAKAGKLADEVDEAGSAAKQIDDVVGRVPGDGIVPNNTRTYAHNMVENPGPLASLPNNPAANFAGGKYNTITLEDDLVLYKAGQAGGGRNALGQWFTREPVGSVAQVRIDLAVKPQWTDASGALTGMSPVESVYQIKIPKGTAIYEGPVGSQGGIYLGGQDVMQIYVNQPWNIRGVQVLDELPIGGN